jgi:ABC-type Na+ efflux pump permease subunit
LKPVLFRDRSRPLQIVLGGIIPAATGALAGVLLGVSAGAYWAVGAVAAIGGFLSGFEHLDGWGGADRGLVAGFIYGVALLVAHAIAGTDAKVSLGKFPPLLAVITAILGMLLSAAGGRLARHQRERAEARGETAPASVEAEPSAPPAPADRPPGPVTR